MLTLSVKNCVWIILKYIYTLFGELSSLAKAVSSIGFFGSLLYYYILHPEGVSVTPAYDSPNRPRVLGKTEFRNTISAYLFVPPLFFIIIFFFVGGDRAPMN